MYNTSLSWSIRSHQGQRDWCKKQLEQEIPPLSYELSDVTPGTKISLDDWNQRRIERAKCRGNLTWFSQRHYMRQEESTDCAIGTIVEMRKEAGPEPGAWRKSERGGGGLWNGRWEHRNIEEEAEREKRRKKP